MRDEQFDQDPDSESDEQRLSVIDEIWLWGIVLVVSLLALVIAAAIGGYVAQRFTS